MASERMLTWLWRNLLLVVLYVPTAILGIGLAIPPGNVTPLYPAAGLAFAAYLLLGRGILPGIFVGGFLGNLAGILRHGIEPAAVSASLLIGVGEVLAVVLAAAALTRLAPTAGLLDSPRHVLWLFTVSLFWLVSPSVGVTALAVHGLVPWSDYAYTWITWWLGDAIGVMVVVPLLLLAWQRLQPPRRALRIDTGMLVAAASYSALVAAFSLAPWPVGFVVIPATMLLVLRYQTGGAALASLLCSVLVIGIVLAGGGLYGDYALNERLLLVQLLIGVNAFTGYFLAGHVRVIARLHSGIDQARQESERDHLTGLLNRRGFERYASQALHQERQGDHGMTLIMLDIDDFKVINDRHGHDFGDRVLAALGGALRGILRATDHAARLGGDEFVLLLDTTSGAELDAICERLLAVTADLSVPGAPAEFGFTLSGGIAHSSDGPGLADLVASADKRLYQAKERGKNQLVRPDRAPGAATTAGALT